MSCERRNSPSAREHIQNGHCQQYGELIPFTTDPVDARNAMTIIRVDEVAVEVVGTLLPGGVSVDQVRVGSEAAQLGTMADQSVPSGRIDQRLDPRRDMNTMDTRAGRTHRTVRSVDPTSARVQVSRKSQQGQPSRNVTALTVSCSAWISTHPKQRIRWN